MSDWSDLTTALKGSLDKLSGLLQSDDQLKAFTTSDAIEKDVTFGIKSSGSDNSLLITVTNGGAKASTGASKDALFTLSALPEQWKEHFKEVPAMPYQSYWGMFGMNIKQKGIEVLGDQTAFAQWTHVWRRVLELTHDAHCGPMKEDEQPEPERDFLTGKYTYLEAPVWGRCKIFYEYSGEGKQPIVFLHTAGSDSRQYHGVMNDAKMRKKCIMYAFDLPGHGRSFPSKKYAPGAHTNTEDSYVGMITAFVKGLGLRRPIICGASMAGQVCLAVAIRHREVGAAGVIPLQGSEYLNMERQWHDRSPLVNQSLFNPEWVYGMMSPITPHVNKQLIWHLYSAQAYGIFHGDLDFYFGGWDGRSRVASIDTQNCPVYMLTGEYDWSNTPEMGQKTAGKIPGAIHKSMPDLGHFPATENPAKFVPHLIEAIDHIQKDPTRYPEEYPGYCSYRHDVSGHAAPVKDGDLGKAARRALRDGSLPDVDHDQAVDSESIKANEQENELDSESVKAHERANELEREEHFRSETAHEQPLFNNGVPPPMTSIGHAVPIRKFLRAPPNIRSGAVNFGSHERTNRLEKEHKIVQRESFQPPSSNNGRPPPVSESSRINEEPQLVPPNARSELREHTARLARDNLIAARASRERLSSNNRHYDARTELPPIPSLPSAPHHIPATNGSRALEQLHRSVGLLTDHDIPPSLKKLTPGGLSLQLPPHQPINPGTPSSASRNTPLRPEATLFEGQALIPETPPSLVPDNNTQPSASANNSLRSEATPFERRALFPYTPPSIPQNNFINAWDGSVLNGSPANNHGGAFGNPPPPTDNRIGAGNIYQNPFSGQWLNSAGQEVACPFIKYPPNPPMTKNAEAFHRERQQEEAARAASGREPLPPPHNLPGQLPSANPNAPAISTDLVRHRPELPNAFDLATKKRQQEQQERVAMNLPPLPIPPPIQAPHRNQYSEAIRVPMAFGIPVAQLQQAPNTPNASVIERQRRAAIVERQRQEEEARRRAEEKARRRAEWQNNSRYSHGMGWLPGSTKDKSGGLGSRGGHVRGKKDGGGGIGGGA
ncbi:hypothetical protein G6011_02938 [Alternaria panax]|uniref:AB hydrolase-1 domain-containing protein n=1 Tax=Alternaria panax TaxID=48097 RepID=A0AAD4FAB1_9PLEO|nr:hypothetical protein G6011_02938 [Alternaria panax]